MSIKRRTPLIALCLDAARIRVQTSECGGCTPGTTSLRLTQAGCVKYEEVCVEVEQNYGCGTNNMPAQQQITMRELPRASLTYPLHEIDVDGFAVFVLDNKLATLGQGRYRAEVLRDNVPTFVFDVDAMSAEGAVRAIAVDRQIRGGSI